MVHQTFVWWALYILFKIVKSLIRHSGLAIGNVRHVRWFSWTLLDLSDFSDWACTYFPSSKLYMACANIGWASEDFCMSRKFLESFARWACKNQMLGVKPCNCVFLSQCDGEKFITVMLTGCIGCGISNFQQLGCLFCLHVKPNNKEKTKLCITGPLWGESTNDW